MKAIATQLATIVSPDGVSDWDNIDVIRQEQIKRAIATENLPSCIVYPRTQAELAEILTCADQNNWRVLPYGSGSKLS